MVTYRSERSYALLLSNLCLLRIHWQGSGKILRHDYCIDAFVVPSMAADRLTALNQPLLGIRVSPNALRYTTGTKLSDNTSDSKNTFRSNDKSDTRNLF